MPEPPGSTPPAGTDKHQFRVRRMVLAGSSIAGAAGLGWGVFFAVLGAWVGVGFELVTVSLCVATAWLAWQGRTRTASRLMIAVLYGVVFFFAAVADVPTAEVPRSAHQLMFALGLVSCLLMRDERAWLRHGVPVLCFATWVLLGSTNRALPSAFALPEVARASGAWINLSVAALMVYVTMHLIQTETAERSALEGELRDGLMRGELLLHFQPQVASDGRVIGAEALARWNHPLRGMVSPGEFIPLAERTGLMVPLGDWVLRAACQQLAAWAQRPQTAALTLAVNVSASQFLQADFVNRVLDIAEHTSIEPARLKLELTESMLARDLDQIAAKMGTLKARGIGFSLDDFGTGFSSLSYLRRLPLDQLKIDQSFVGNMLESPSDAAIARTVVDLGRSLGLQVIAEGVETDLQRQALLEFGCETYQGYLFGRPMPTAQFDAFVARSGPAAQPSSGAMLVRQPTRDAK